METIDYDKLMRGNAVRVFSERDAGRRLGAIRELYTEDAVLTEPEVVCEGHAAISDAVAHLLQTLPPTFTFTQVGVVIGHHGLERLRCKTGQPNGPTAVTGMDVAHFRGGRIAALYVFLDAPPAA